MGAVRKLSIALTEELASEVDQAVAAGDYASTSEVIRDALRLWRRDRDATLAETARLRRLWEEGLASGEPIEGGFDPEDIAQRGRVRRVANRLPEATDEWFESIKHRGAALLSKKCDSSDS